MRISTGERFEANQPHEFIDLVAFITQDAAGDEASFDVAADGEPGEEIRVLKDEAAFGARSGDGFGADPEFAGIGSVESCNETE